MNEENDLVPIEMSVVDVFLGLNETVLSAGFVGYKVLEDEIVLITKDGAEMVRNEFLLGSQVRFALSEAEMFIYGYDEDEIPEGYPCE